MLRQSVEKYIKLRKAFGCTVRDEERYLHSFTSFAEKWNNTFIRSLTSVEWARKGKTEHQRAIRLQAVVRLAKYLKLEDNRHEIPEKDVFCRKNVRPTPYIYSDHEVQALMSAALNLTSNDALKPLLMHTLIGLLAVTGMRISEAINLKLGDITKDGIVINNSKYRKNRLVPVHSSTRKALDRYLERRTCYPSKCDNVFVSTVGTPLFHDSVYCVFNRLLKAINPANNKKPRLIDFRHTFATRALLKCAANRDHVGQQILALSTYLGHAHVESTYWYLENTPELMADIAKTCVDYIEERHHDHNSSTY